MLNPVGRRVRVKGFDAETFQTVPQLAGVLSGSEQRAGHHPAGAQVDAGVTIPIYGGGGGASFSREDAQQFCQRAGAVRTVCRQ
ncbi:hypothetical protein GCM10007171_43100 [Dickeya fangzhongdai]|nr:hypothetical protein GCM10007171_43100 [Dickeya fangzhongdai]